MDKCGCSDDKTYGPHGSRIAAMVGYKGGVYKFPVCDNHLRFYEETGNWDITILTEPEPTLTPSHVTMHDGKCAYCELHPTECKGAPIVAYACGSDEPKGEHFNICSDHTELYQKATYTWKTLTFY